MKALVRDELRLENGLDEESLSRRSQDLLQIYHSRWELESLERIAREFETMIEKGARTGKETKYHQNNHRISPGFRG